MVFILLFVHGFIIARVCKRKLCAPLEGIMHHVGILPENHQIFVSDEIRPSKLTIYDKRICLNP